MGATRRIHKLKRKLKNKGTPEEQRTRTKAHLRLSSGYMSILDSTDALNREDYVAACASVEQVMLHCEHALNNLRSLEESSA